MPYTQEQVKPGILFSQTHKLIIKSGLIRSKHIKQHEYAPESHTTSHILMDK